MRNNLSNGVSIRDKHRGVVGLPAITWLQWDRGDDGGRLAVGVLRGDVGDEVCLEVAVALVDRRGVVSFFAWLPWNRGHNRGRLAVGVLGGDVRNNIGLELAVALVDRRGVVSFII